MTNDVAAFVGQFPIPDFALKDIQAMKPVEQRVMDGVNALISGYQGGCPFKFETVAIKNEKKTKSLHYAKFDTEIICRFFPDRKSQSIVKVSPRNEFPESILYIDPDTQEVFGELADAYKRFIEGKSFGGTSLRKWGEIDEATVCSLETARIYTVEQICSMPQNTWISKFSHDLDDVYKNAREFLAGKEVARRADKQADEMVKLIDEKAKLEAEVRAMQKQMLELLAQGKANKAKKKGNRPKKVRTENPEPTDDELLAEASRA